MSKLAWLLLACVGCASAPPRAPSAPRAPLPEAWSSFAPLVGAWSGAGSDPARPSTGGFTLEPDLDGKVLIRRGTNDTATEHHRDLTVLYHAPGGGVRATYFDNEGHTIAYAVTVAAGGRGVVFLSDELAGVPRFRLTYQLGDDGALSVTFDVAPPGASEFRTYVRGVLHRA